MQAPDDDLQLEPVDEQKARGWYKRWRQRIEDWTAKHTDHQFAGLLLLLPDLLALVFGLLRDKRVPFLLKAQLLTAAAYVITPLDFIPEAVLGVLGLTEDLGVMAMVMLWLTSIVKLDPQVLRDHWPRQDDPLEVIDMLKKRVLDNAETLFSKEVWDKMQARFGRWLGKTDPDVIEIDPISEPRKRRFVLRRKRAG
jgi:uncharacterized membrane protein YkvA (DUF1232 family)